MRPHLLRLNQLQEGAQRLPPLIQAIVAKENSKRIIPGSFKCVDRLLSEIEMLEDRVEALNEIMEVQRQRLTRSGVDLKMVILPPDITTTLTAFGSSETLGNQPKVEEVVAKRWTNICLPLLNVFSSQENSCIKKRKLDSERRVQYEEAMLSANQHLDELERLLDGDLSVVTDLELRHNQQKPLLDQVLKSGHILVDELQSGEFHVTFKYWFCCSHSLFINSLFTW